MSPFPDFHRNYGKPTKLFDEQVTSPLFPASFARRNTLCAVVAVFVRMCPD
jgi:hypothetical protein